LGRILHDEGLLSGARKACKVPVCLFVNSLEARTRFDQEQNPFENILSLNGVVFIAQLTVKLAQSIYVSDGRS